MLGWCYESGHYMGRQNLVGASEVMLGDWPLNIFGGYEETLIL